VIIGYLKGELEESNPPKLFYMLPIFYYHENQSRARIQGVAKSIIRQIPHRTTRNDGGITAEIIHTTAAHRKIS
jgi:hypothetical protein